MSNHKLRSQTDKTVASLAKMPQCFTKCKPGLAAPTFFFLYFTVATAHFMFTYYLLIFS